LGKYPWKNPWENKQQDDFIIIKIGAPVKEKMAH
jgi:hypothetical protein